MTWTDSFKVIVHFLSDITFGNTKRLEPKCHAGSHEGKLGVSKIVQQRSLQNLGVRDDG
jgi:hypothetical protein